MFSFAVDLGTIQATNNPVSWAVGRVRDPCIGYAPTSGGEMEARRPYYSVHYSDPLDMVRVRLGFENDLSHRLF